MVEGLQRICILNKGGQLSNRKGEITQTVAMTLNFTLYRDLEDMAGLELALSGSMA